MMKVYYYNSKGFYTHSEEAASVPVGATDVAMPDTILKPGEAFHFNGIAWAAMVNPAFAGNAVVSKELRAIKIVDDAQKAIDALLAPKANVQHLMEAAYDTWVLLAAIKTHLGITDGNLGVPGAEAYARLVSRQTMYAGIQAVRTQRDTALQELNNE
jgi:hypothetical protein